MCPSVFTQEKELSRDCAKGNKDHPCLDSFRQMPALVRNWRHLWASCPKHQRREMLIDAVKSQQIDFPWRCSWHWSLQDFDGRVIWLDAKCSWSCKKRPANRHIQGRPGALAKHPEHWQGPQIPWVLIAWSLASFLSRNHACCVSE